MIPRAKAQFLEGRKGLVVGFANEQSIVSGCAWAFYSFGAKLALTHLNQTVPDLGQ